MKQIAFALIMLLMAGAALAQEVTPAVPFSTPAPLVIVTPAANDARAASCSASTLPNFEPYVVRPGDHLDDLLASSQGITVAQVAALNCIDDPNALPVGAVIWLPALPKVSASLMTPEATAVPEVATTSEATVEANATEAVTEVATARIANFSASASPITNTSALTFNWTATGTNAYFYLCMSDDCVRPINAQPVPLNGSLSFSGFQSAGTYRYRLDVDGPGGPATENVSVSVTCAQKWLGGVGASPLCPQDPALSVYGVWQPFEHGVMIWFSDVKQIYVMRDDGQFKVYEDQFVDGQPNPGEQAPKDRFTPVRGFGLIWEALGGANSPLGWATTKEVGYDSARQAAGSSSYTTYIQGPGSTVYAITQLPGSDIGYWAQVAW